MGQGGSGRSEEAAREVTIKIRRRSCFVAVVGAEGRKEGEVRSTTGVKPRRERKRERKREIDRERETVRKRRAVG